MLTRKTPCFVFCILSRAASKTLTIFADSAQHMGQTQDAAACRWLAELAGGICHVKTAVVVKC